MAGDITKCGFVSEGATIAGRAQEAISGGQFVKLMSGAGITNQTNYTQAIEVALADATADAEYAIGMALNNATSGNDVTVALPPSIVIATAGGSMTAPGKSVKVATGTDATAVQADTTGVSGIGINLTTAASGELVLVKLGGCK